MEDTMTIKRAYLPGAALLLCLAMAAACGAATGGTIRADDVWAPPSMAAYEAGSGTVSGVFMTLVNRGQTPDRLIGGKTNIADVVEIHETILQGDVAKMQELQDGLEVPAGGRVELKPGSYHVMLINLKRDLVPGDTFTLELQFERAGTLIVEPQVRMP